MRDIKFRAWTGERMLNRTLFDRNWYSKDDKCVMVAMPRDARTLEVMQYTGLKDVNGVEIYEGDLLVIRHKKGECLLKEKPTALYFSDGAFQFELLSESREMFLFEVCSSNTSAAISHKCEVVGNIHENSELLK